MRDLTKREEFIKSIFLPKQRSSKKKYLPEEEVYDIIEKISKMGERYGFIGVDESQSQKKSDKRKHKYDTWIAKEVKKDIDRKNNNEEYLYVIDRFSDIRLILDWITNDDDNPDLFGMSFDEALKKQDDWHNSLYALNQIEKIEIPELDESRVIFRFKDQIHFLYKLNAGDLRYEGANMGNCVGGKSYKTKVRKKRSIIISIRDKKNEPHVTLEIDVASKTLLQKYGKANLKPIEKYETLLKEFLLYASNYPKIKEDSTLKFLNLKLT